MDIKDIRELGYFSDKDWILILESFLQYIWNCDSYIMFEDERIWNGKLSSMQEITIDDLWFHTELTLGASEQPLQDTDTVELR